MRLLLVLCFAMMSLYADMARTTVGCVDKNDLMEFRQLFINDKIKTLEDFYKFSIERDCEMIDASMEIKQIGKPYDDGTMLIYVKKFDKDLYIISNAVSNKFTEENHLFNKSF